MSGKKIHRSANDYLQYLKGGNSGRERHAFEREMETDPFEKEAMEGLGLLKPGQAEEDLLELHSRLHKRLSRKRRIAWYSVAASIASLLIVGTLFFQLHDFNPDEIEKNLREDLFAPGTSGEAEAAEEDLTPSIRTPENAPKESSDQEKVMVPEAQPARNVPEEIQPERILHVEAEAVPAEDKVQFDQVAPEAGVVPSQQEISREEGGRRAEKRMDRLSEPVAAQPAEMQQKAISREEYQPLVPGEVSGTVVSGEDLQPISGASVVVKGRNLGVITNAEGHFTLPMEDDSNRTVVASFVGMEPREYQVNQESENRLVMQPDAMTLDEVVLVEQGLQPVGAPSGSATPSVGYEAFKDYIRKQIRFPDVETDTDRMVVILGFTVTANGEIRDINPLKTGGEPFTREAIRLLTEGPSWNPAFDENGPMEEYVRLRIVFKR